MDDFRPIFGGRRKIGNEDVFIHFGEKHGLQDSLANNDVKVAMILCFCCTNNFPEDSFHEFTKTTTVQRICL